MNKDLKPEDYDDEGFRACKKCGSRNIYCHSFPLDEIYIMCWNCDFCTSTGEFYDILNEWNERDSESKTVSSSAP